MTYQICGAAVDLYAVLKNLQTLFAALVAFGAPPEGKGDKPVETATAS